MHGYLLALAAVDRSLGKVRNLMQTVTQVIRILLQLRIALVRRLDGNQGRGD